MRLGGCFFVFGTARLPPFNNRILQIIITYYSTIVIELIKKQTKEECIIIIVLAKYPCNRGYQFYT